MTSTTVHYRYEVGWLTDDDAFDAFDWYQTRDAAMRCAKRLHSRVGHSTAQTFVFDRMARIGQPELWNFDGTLFQVVHFRQPRAQPALHPTAEKSEKE